MPARPPTPQIDRNKLSTTSPTLNSLSLIEISPTSKPQLSSSYQKVGF